MEPIFEKGVDQQSMDEARILLVCGTICAIFCQFGSIFGLNDFLGMTGIMFLYRAVF